MDGLHIRFLLDGLGVGRWVWQGGKVNQETVVHLVSIGVQ